MDIAVVGSPAFTLGFQLAGLSDLHNPEAMTNCIQPSVPYSTTKPLVSWWSTPP